MVLAVVAVVVVVVVVDGGVEAWVDVWGREEDDVVGCCVAVMDEAVDILRRKFIRKVVIVEIGVVFDN